MEGQVCLCRQACGQLQAAYSCIPGRRLNFGGKLKLPRIARPCHIFSRLISRMTVLKPLRLRRMCLCGVAGLLTEAAVPSLPCWGMGRSSCCSTGQRPGRWPKFCTRASVGWKLSGSRPFQNCLREGGPTTPSAFWTRFLKAYPEESWVARTFGRSALRRVRDVVAIKDSSWPKRAAVTSPIYLILKRHGLTAPDRRPLHAYAATDAEFADLAAAVGSDRPLALYAPLFVLWASEEIRRNNGAGNLSWFFLLEHLGIQHRQDLGRQWVSEGLDFWKRPLRRRASDGKTLFLYSLLAEGGLPDAFLSRDSGYAAALLGAIADIEREALGLTDVAGLDRIAAFRSSGLPAALQGQESCALLRDLALAFVDLRRDLPARIDIDAALLWLDRNRSGWAEKLPLRLSQEARQALLLPALARQIERPVSGALAQRLLLPSAGGTAWTGGLRILRGGLLPYGLLPKVDRGFVLRLVAADGSALRAHPDLGGWRVEAARDLKLALYPWAPAVLSAYADGRALGEVVIDPGLPEPGESALLWRSEGSGQVRALVPSVGGRTRSDRLWLLSSVEPVVSDGLQLDPPLPGPGGKVWPISGRGRVIVGNELVDIVTGSEEDEPGARFLVLAELARLVRVEGGLPAYIGTPRFLGARAELSMRDVTAAVQVAEGRGLGIRRFDWVEGGERIASTRAVFLPADLDVTLREAGQNLAIEVRGLPLNWRLAVLLDGSRHVLPD